MTSFQFADGQGILLNVNTQNQIEARSIPQTFFMVNSVNEVSFPCVVNSEKH